jgi:ATP phosphoribosyltransferase
MLKFALPNKGALAEGALRLLSEAGYACARRNRELSVADREHGIDFVFLRPGDIAVYVGRGVLDLGITGRDFSHEADLPVDELLALGFGGSKFCYAIPKDRDLTPDDFAGLRIATSYPHLVRRDLERRGIEAEIVVLDGAVEISVLLGVADAVADVVQSGRTMVEAGLKVVGEPLMVSEAVVIGGARPQEPENVRVCIERLRGIVMAREYAMVEYDVAQEALEQVCALTPGIEAPTVSPLSRQGWVAVKAMVKRRGLNEIIDQLAALGAKGIIATDIRTCRI